MQLRKLTQADLEPLSELYTYYATQTVYTYYDAEATPRYMRSLFSGRGHACTVAVEDLKVIGYVHVAPSIAQRNHGTLAVYLDPDHIGQRRGEKLVRHGEAMAEELGYAGLIIGICTENQRSRRLFERMGYRLTHVVQGETEKFGRSLDTAYYIKTLREGRNENQND